MPSARIWKIYEILCSLAMNDYFGLQCVKLIYLRTIVATGSNLSFWVHFGGFRIMLEFARTSFVKTSSATSRVKIETLVPVKGFGELTLLTGRLQTMPPQNLHNPIKYARSLLFP